MLKSVLKEPLVHFVAFAVAIFGAYAFFNPSETVRANQIVITSPKIEQLASFFASTWQRPPTMTELKGLIDDYAKEEIYYRQALSLGLDKNDALIRRRLRQKMEFLIDAEAESVPPTEAELEAYLRSHPGKFEIDTMIAFQQVYLDPHRRGDRTEKDAVATLEELRRGGSADPAALGDATLLPSELPLTGLISIGHIFGGEFASALEEAAPSQWVGPIKSAYGLHIVRVLERKTVGIPALDEVRGAVSREWANEKRKEHQQAYFKKLLTGFDIVIEGPAQIAAGR